MDNLLIRIFDYSPYIAVAVLIILLFRDGIVDAVSKLLNRHQENASDKREHRQTLELSRADFEFQERTAANLREHEVQRYALALVEEQLQWSREDFKAFDERLKKIERCLNDIKNQLRIIAQILSRVEDDLRNKQ